MAPPENGVGVAIPRSFGAFDAVFNDIAAATSAAKSLICCGVKDEVLDDIVGVVGVVGVVGRGVFEVDGVGGADDAEVAGFQRTTDLRSFLSFHETQHFLFSDHQAFRWTFFPSKTEISLSLTTLDEAGKAARCSLVRATLTTTA